ncbi:LPO_1073/Vpar_1526 family protein, partial [Halomonas sp. ND22Bw]|uniref:LPO_1073/Vpar_1526 family protein n=1 Tax=Halomonas sp. ND22Bw TaxID=2054178 RepID=UPI001C63838E
GVVVAHPVLLMTALYPVQLWRGSLQSKRYVDAFGEKLMSSLSERMDEKISKRLASPDVQASINDAVMCSARKTSSANLDVLTSLVAEKVGVEEESDADLVLTESIKVMEKLSLNYIRFVSFIYFVRNVRVSGEGDLGKENITLFNNFLPVAFPVDELRKVRDSYLTYAGLFMSGRLYNESFCEIVAAKFGFSIQGDVCGKSLKKDSSIFEDCSYLTDIILAFGYEAPADLDVAPINDVADFIAISYLNSKGLSLKYPGQ